MPAVRRWLRAALVGAALLVPAGAAAQVRPMWQWEDAVHPGATDSARMVREAQMNALRAEFLPIQAAHLRMQASTPSTPPDEARRMLAAAQEAEQEAVTALHLAPRLFEQALALAPRDADALTGLAHQYGQRRDYRRQLELLERARDTGDYTNNLLGRPHLYFSLGVAYTRLLRFAEARDAYVAGLNAAVIDEDQSSMLCNLAETYGYLHDMELSIETYRRCIDAEPSRATGWWGLAIAHDRNGQDLDSTEAAGTACLMDPQLTDIDSPEVFYVPDYERHYYLGIAHEALGADERALIDWESYLVAGGPNAPWVERARAHRDRLVARLRAQARRGGAPAQRGGAQGASAQ